MNAIEIATQILNKIQYPTDWHDPKSLLRAAILAVGHISIDRKLKRRIKYYIRKEVQKWQY